MHESCRDRPQWLREQAIEEMIEGRCPVLVSTDVCARGLDMKDIEHVRGFLATGGFVSRVMQVINYDMPNDRDTYVHRIGRSGRAGNPGRATTFVDVREDGDCRVARELVQVR